MRTSRWIGVAASGAALLASLSLGGRAAASRAPSEDQEHDHEAVQAAPPGVTPDWWAEVRRSIQSSEYAIAWQEPSPQPGTAGTWRASNRAHGLRVVFTDDGPRVAPRSVSDHGWSVGLSLRTVGWLGAGRPVDGATIEAQGNRVEYRRSGVTEWYVNSAQGIEQGFTLGRPPSAESDPLTTWVALEIELTGTLSSRLDVAGEAVILSTATGASVVSYAGLEAVDATGRSLQARLKLDGVRLSLLVDTTDAVYPVVVDPIITSADWTFDSDQWFAYLGYSVGTAGDVNGDGYSDVIVGAFGYDDDQADEGRVYVFFGSPTGLSTTADWTAESNQSGSYFGMCVATAGDVNGDGYGDVIIGAYYYSTAAGNAGRVFAFYGSPTGLGSSPDWIADGDQSVDRFGYSLGTAGDVNGDGYDDVIIGAYGYDHGENNEGRAYVYYGSPTGLAATPAWVAESNQGGAEFGFSVSTAGDVNGDGYSDVIVGAHYYDNGEDNEGRAFVYLGSPRGLMSQAAWTGEINWAQAGFGNAVAAAGDVNGDGYGDVIIGACNYTYQKIFETSHPFEGRAYVYHGSPTGLGAEPAWWDEIKQDYAYFGWSVASAGDFNGDGYGDVIVSAPRYENGSASEVGRAYVYLGSATGLRFDSDQTTWSAVSDQGRSWYGRSVATAGDVNGDGYSDLIVGSDSYNTGHDHGGRAWLYLGSPEGPSPTPVWTVDGDQAGASLGHSVSWAGDVNGDGFDDVVVGAPYYDNGQTDVGRAYVFLGSSTGLSTVPAWAGEGEGEGARYGISVGGAGDVNGDGFGDLIVGAYHHSDDQTEEGRAYVYLGSASGLEPAASWIADGNQVSAWFGYPVGWAGDVNGDGYADIVVGALGYDGGEVDEGRVFVYHGSPTGLSADPSWTAEGNQAGAWFGASAATAGDVNGDGYSDLIAGSPLFDNGETDEGRAFVFLGSPSGLNPTASWMAESDQNDAWFGFSVATAGDVDGDGFSDVVVGAVQFDDGETDEGRALVFRGSSGGLSAAPSWIMESDQAGALLGYSVASAGDVNGDGYSDVIVGAPNFDNGEDDEGRAFLFLGSASGLSPLAGWMTESNRSGALAGTSVASAGDVNGDGYSDVIVGIPRYDVSSSQRGRAAMFYGNTRPGLPIVPAQRRLDDLTPIQRLGLSGDAGGLVLSYHVRTTPFGRGKVKLEWEVKPLGVPFDGTGTGSSATWVDTGTDGVSIAEPVTGLADRTPYHWRVRLHYHPVTCPLAHASRWVSAFGNGWQEADVRTGVAPIPVELMSFVVE